MIAEIVRMEETAETGVVIVDDPETGTGIEIGIVIEIVIEMTGGDLDGEEMMIKMEVVIGIRHLFIFNHTPLNNGTKCSCFLGVKGHVMEVGETAGEGTATGKGLVVTEIEEVVTVREVVVTEKEVVGMEIEEVVMEIEVAVT